MMKSQYRMAVWGGLIAFLTLLSAPHIVLAYTQAANPAQSGTTITDVVILTGVTADTLIVADGGVLVLLGVSVQDIVVEPGGVAYVYGMVIGNALNYGGYLEVYGIVGGYIYTDADATTLIDPDTIVIATPPPITPTPFPTPILLTPVPTSTPPSVTPTPTPTPVTPTPMPTPVLSSDVIDLSISLYKAANTPAERAPYEEILAHFADAIYEMTNGVHKVRNVTIYQNGRHAQTADVVWKMQEWPCAFINGYGMPGYSVYMGDLFDFTDFTVDRRCGGYVLAHEWGHYYYGLYDEYRSGPGSPCPASNPGCPHPQDTPVRNSVMNDNWRACIEGDLNWLNFSIPKNQTRNNAQYRIYNASAWEVLARPTTQDPRDVARMALRERSYFPELTGVAPTGNRNASLELTIPDASLQARSMLNIIWADDATAAAPDTFDVTSYAAPSSTSVNPNYQGHIESALGETVEYPAPLLLVARVVNGVPIAKANVQAGVLRPDMTLLKVTLQDDGRAPDVLADDGLYSGFVTYTQAGTYYAFARFDNRSGLAEFTRESLEHATGPNGETDYPAPYLVGENFFAVANTVITVSNVRTDDHGNIATEATSLTTDNVDVTGRIDYAGDVDMFAVTPLRNGKLVLRLSRFAFDMQPKVQVLAADGVRVLKAFEFSPAEGQYFFTSLRGKTSEVFYVAVQHLDPNAIGGLYDISIGPALPNLIESPPLGWLLFTLPLAIAGPLALYFLMRRRPTRRQAVAPRRRDYVPMPSHRSQPKEMAGGSIYKSATEKSKEETEF